MEKLKSFGFGVLVLLAAAALAACGRGVTEQEQPPYT